MTQIEQQEFDITTKTGESSAEIFQGSASADVFPCQLTMEELTAFSLELYEFWSAQNNDPDTLKQTLLSRFNSYCYQTPESLLASLENTCVITLMRDQRNKIIGYAEAMRDASAPHKAVIAVVVAPECRRQRFAEKLLLQLQNLCASIDITTLLATISAQNEAIVGLVRKQGFRTHYDIDTHCYHVEVSIADHK